MPNGVSHALTGLKKEEANGSSDAEVRAAAFELELEYLQVDQAMALSRGVIAPHLVVLALFLCMMLPFSSQEACVVWALGFAIYLCARLPVNAQYELQRVAERKARLRQWHRIAVTNAFLYGSFVGTAALIAFPGSPFELRLLWTLILTMVIAAGPRLLTLRQFIALALMPLVLLCISWLTWGGELGPSISAALVTLAVPFTLLAHYFHLGQRKTFERHLRNEALTAELASRNRALESLAQARTLLIATASHDLRQPVHALGLLMDDVKKSRDPKTLRRRHNMAASCVAVVSEMLTNLLDFARLESGSLPLKMQATDLKALTEDTARIFEPLARQKALRLRTIGVQPPVCVHTDPYLLRRLLFNLVANAVQYTSQGHIDIELERTSLGVTLHVRDTGLGIEPDRLEDIFRDYVTSAPKVAGVYAGVGLGLGIVRRSAELLGHRLSVRSTIGQGSCFSLHLGNAVPHPCAASAANPHVHPGQKVVAFVDNDPVVLDCMVAMIRSWGYVVVAGASALHVARMLEINALKPDLIVSDLHLGIETDGFQAIAALRNQPAAARIPAILLTADLGSIHKRRSEAEHIRMEYKPLRPAHLRGVLSETLQSTQDDQRLPVH